MKAALAARIGMAAKKIHAARSYDIGDRGNEADLLRAEAEAAGELRQP